MKFFDAFAGIGGIRLGMEVAGNECVGYSEISPYSRRSYQAMHDTANEILHEDITQITEEDWLELKEKGVEMLVGGFPCFIAGTLITTDKGLKPIEDIREGDNVLTHNKVYQKVVVPMKKEKKGIYRMRVFSRVHTYVTEEHPFYVREILRRPKKGEYPYALKLSEPKWVAAKDLDIYRHLIGFATDWNQKDNVNMDEVQLTKLGQDLANGSLTSVPMGILQLSSGQLRTVLHGYASTQEKTRTDNYYMRLLCDTEELAYGLGQAFQKAFGFGYDIARFGEKYEVITRGIPDVGGMLWYPVKEMFYVSEWEGAVYNLEVANDNSYVANNMVVHNCQAFSIAGHRKGFEDTRGTLFFDMARGVRAINPKVVVLENVKGLINHDNGQTLEVIVKTLEDLGYVVEWELFNSKYFGVAQNRERIVILAWRKDIFVKTVLNEIKATHTEVTTSIEDILEPELIEKHSLDRLLPYLMEHLKDKPFRHGEINVIGQCKGGYESAGRVLHPKGICTTLLTMKGGGREPKVYHEGRLRRLSPIECWRLQGFPDELFYKAEEVVAMTKLYEQSGNSVSVPVFEAVALAIAKVLNDDEEENVNELEAVHS